MKRTSILMAGVASLLPSQLAPLLADPPPPASVPAFTPPDTPLLLTRTLWRSLRDGQEIMVKRIYEVRFSRDRGGFLVDGRLIDTAVDAPAPLALLAEVERKRPDQGMFPLHLDGAGRIVAKQATAVPGEAHRIAEDRTRAILASSAMGSDARQQAGALARSILESSIGASAWPSDLFNPSSLARREQRNLALDGGQQGKVEVSVEVRGRAAGSLPQSIERRVVTEVEGTSRFSREVWTLEPTRPNL